ncbi:MAG: hypothetical protein ACREI8_06290 [Myxococcota bacterium]
MAFRAGTASTLDSWLPRERLIFWLLLVATFTALFFSLLPLALLAFALAEEVVWRSSSLLLAVFLASALGAALRANLRLAREGHPSVIPRVWAVGVTLSACGLLLELANGLGLFAVRSFGVYLLGPLLLLGMACLMFVAFLLRSSRGG